MRKIACPCGAVIPSRQMYDCYRLTPRHREVREQNHLGFYTSLPKRFMDRSEAATWHRETVLRLAAFTAPGSRNAAIPVDSPVLQIRGVSGVYLPAV